MELNNTDEHKVEVINAGHTDKSDELFTLLNVQSLEEIKTIFEDYKTLKLNGQTELERQQTKFGELKTQYDKQIEEKQEIAKRLAQLERQQLEDRLDEEIRAAARKRNANNPDAVLKLVDRKGLLTDDGSINKEVVAKHVEVLAETDTYLFRADVPSVPSNRDGSPLQNFNAVKEVKDAILKKYRKW